MAVHTIKLDGFGIAEIREGADLLRMYLMDDMTSIANDYFVDDDVQLGYNDSSGIVFITNSEYQVLVRDGNRLDLFIVLPWTGIEGTLDKLLVDLKYNADDFGFDDLDDLSNYVDYMSESDKKLVLKELERKS